MRRALVISLAAIAIVAIAIAALIGYVLSERAFPSIVARIVAESGGRVTIEAPTGSIAGTMRFRRITWRADDATVTADDVVVDWNPGALWSRRLSIAALGARRVDISLKPSDGAPAAPPTDLRLPLAVDIAHTSVGELTWQTGPRGGRVTGIAFAYSGDSTAHRVRDLKLATEYGTLEGAVQVGTLAPIPVTANAAIAGDGALAGVKAKLQVEGAIAQLTVSGEGSLRDATMALQATATPFAATPISAANADLAAVDLATFDASLPHTRARVHLEARPRDAGVSGSFSLINADAGPIDAARLPIATISSQFDFENDVVTLTMIDATLPEGGGARGSGAVTLGNARSARFALEVRDLDLARVHSKLVTTRLAGKVSADAAASRQVLEGDVRDRDIGLAFRAVVDETRVDVKNFRATTAGGTLSGSARVALNETNAFNLDATMRNLDPSRIIAMPKASLDGTLKASGVLQPRWRADADVVLASTSRLQGLTTSGRFKGSVAPDAVRNATLDVALASAKLTAKGGIGGASDRVDFAVDVPKLADVAALLPAAVPQPVSGELHAKGVVALTGDIPGGEVDVRADALRIGAYAVATLRGTAMLAPVRAGSRTVLDERPLSLDVRATSLAVPSRTIDAVHASVNGTLAHHRGTFAVSDEDVDASLVVEGSLSDVRTPASAAWSGTLVSLVNRGAVPLTLRAPATLALRADVVRLANARVDVAGGNLDIAELGIDHGRITTRGAFTNLGVVNVARLAGQSLPVETTLVVGGEWTIAAAPRLNGSFAIRRERGDIVAEIGSDGSTERRPIGVSALTIAGKFDDDALDANATFASERGGTANATLAIGAASGVSSGRIARDAPLRLQAHGQLPSLAVFQPWFGTNAALGGRARVEVAASGTVGEPLWSGSAQGDGLRIDAPQYGISATNGTVRARLVTTGIAIDEIRLQGGDGTFSASGLIALPTTRNAAQSSTHVDWKAERFRATNRPDMHLVVSGEGHVTMQNRRVSLTGNIAIDEGRIEYDPTASGELASDIVIKGRTPVSRREAGARDLPLALDVDVDLGRALTFTGEGIDTRLAGRVHVTTSQAGKLLGRGTIRAVNGTYVAFGQKLTIDRGRLIFDGPLDDPALDIVALRKNLAVEAGVELTGTVKVPHVRITSNPPVPENEALAWLITGQGLSGASRVDYAALSTASAALLAGRGGTPLTSRIAKRLGLDDISLQSSGVSSGGTNDVTSQVVVFGKRISDRLSLGYEQGLSLASSAVRLEYALSRQVTLRAEAGQVSGIGIVYRRNFE